MKQLFFSTFLTGLEKPMERLLSKEGGVSVERVVSGGILYRAVKKPSPAYTRQNFLVLYRMKPYKTPDDALKNLLSAGGWLDNIPFEIIDGKRFRITISNGENKVPANMRFVNMLENTIKEHTGLQVNRERPDVELWLVCLKEITLFLWRIDSAKNREQGRFRADVASAIASYAGYNQNSMIMLGCEDETIVAAFKNQGTQKLTCICSNSQSAQKISSSLKGIKAVIGNPEHTEFEEGSQSAVYLHLLRGTKQENQEIDVRSAMYEARRLLAADGKLIVSANKGIVYEALLKNRGFHVNEELSFSLAGRDVCIWSATLQDRENG